MRNSEWWRESTFCNECKFEIEISTYPQFYFGNSNSRNPQDYSNPSLRLDLPSLTFNPDKNDFSYLTDIIGHEIEFGNYYKFLIEKIYAYGKSFYDSSHHFWLIPSLKFHKKGFSTPVVPYDFYYEYSDFLKWIYSAEEDETFSAFDPDGWELNGLVKDNHVYLLFDTQGSIFSNVYVNRQTLNSEITKSTRALKKLISNLSYQIGVDVWLNDCLLYTSPSPRDRQKSRMPSSA